MAHRADCRAGRRGAARPVRRHDRRGLGPQHPWPSGRCAAGSGDMPRGAMAAARHQSARRPVGDRAGPAPSRRWPGGGEAPRALARRLLGMARGEVGLGEAGLAAADLLAARVPLLRSGEERSQAGLLHGCSGPALLFVRMFERTGDPGYLDLAATALGAYLDRCVLTDKGALHVDDGWRTMPYLDGGSVGIGLVIDDFRAHRHVARVEQAAGAIRTAASSTYYAQPGLLRGRAGMMLY